MALTIKHPEAGRLARALAERRGVTITAAVIDALRAGLAAEVATGEDREAGPRSASGLLAIARRYQSLPTCDDRPDEAILGYDDNGVPARGSW